MTSAFSDVKTSNEHYEELSLTEDSSVDGIKPLRANTHSSKGNRKKPDARDEIKAALKTGIRPCTLLAALGIPPREVMLGNWFFEGDLGFIFAPRGLGKTWLALAMAIAIAGDKKCGPWRRINLSGFFTLTAKCLVKRSPSESKAWKAMKTSPC
jgi:hypothetical protein